MGPTHAYLHIGRYPQDIVGLVIVDGTSPHAPIDPRMEEFLKRFKQVTALAPLASRLGLMALVKNGKAGDPIGLSGLADREKRNAFASPRHNYWAAREVALWPRDMELVRALPDASPELPVAVVLAGAGASPFRSQPATRSKHGHVESVAGATHASVLGPRFNDAIVRAIDHIRADAQQR